MKEGSRRNGFEDVKIAAISKAKDEGISDPRELEKIGEDAKRHEIYRIGIESEIRFQDYTAQLKHVRYTLDGTHEEDIEKGIDFWITHENDMRLPDLPVQIKSSKGDAEAFRNDYRYLERDGMMFVFNTGPSVTFGNFKNQYDKEVARIRKLLVAHKIKVY